MTQTQRRSSGNTPAIGSGPSWRVSRRAAESRTLDPARAAGRRAHRPLVDLPAALDRMSDGLAALDRDGKIRFVNRAAAGLVGREVDELLGTYVWAEFPTAVGSVFDQRCREALLTQQGAVFETRFDERETWLQIHVHPSADGVTLVVRDVTQRHVLVAQRRALLEQLLGAEDHERARIASDVHDDSLQAVGALAIWLQLLRGHLPSPTREVEALLTSLDDQVSHATDRLRSLLFTLEPTVADEPIAAGIRLQAAYIFEGSATRWSVRDADGGEELAEAERGQLLRITKEALINVRTHADASEVAVTVRGDAGGQEVVIVDDGAGKDPARFTSATGHRGMATMRERAAVVGGSCTFEASAPAGCTVRVYVPRSGQLGIETAAAGASGTAP